MVDVQQINDLTDDSSPLPTSVCGKDCRDMVRKHLTPAEVEVLRKAARRGMYGQRDETMIMMMAAHGLRACEVVALRWDDINLKGRGELYVRRRKNGNPSVHPLSGPEIRALRQLQREWPEYRGFVFLSERGAPMTTSGLRKIMTRIGKASGLPFPVHAHMLRHAAGYRLINQPGVNLRQVQDWLGHRNVANTIWYTKLAATAFANLEPAFKS